jgi:hypothetical protein
MNSAECEQYEQDGKRVALQSFQGSLRAHGPSR